MKKGIEYAHSGTKQKFNSLISATLLRPAFLGALSVIHLANRGAQGVIQETRVGQNGVHFGLFKFCIQKPQDESDSRVQRLLQSIGVDELPQVMNIDAGAMGPTGFRPLTPEDHEKFMDNLPPWLQQMHDRVVMPTVPGMVSTHGIAGHTGQVYGDVAETAEMRAENNIKDVIDGSLAYDISLLARYAGSPIISKLMKTATP